MSKKQKRVIEKMIDEFVDMNTPGERTMKIGKKLIYQLSPKEAVQLNNYDLKPKANVMLQIETKIKYYLDKLKKMLIPKIFF
ncbi:hypothetical protein [Aquimarina algiphila]|nr:hypothetical protein [Aquimarina algiphila]